jgi:hypothetical protein
MAQEQFPDSIKILDFFHLSEYVWKVAKGLCLAQKGLWHLEQPI